MEAAAVGRAAERLEESVQNELQARAREYLRNRLRIMKEHGYRQSRGELAPLAERLPCPALANGSCLVYEDRPILCRQYGAVIVHPEQANRVFACELNFAPGERVKDALLAAQQQETAAVRSVVETAYVKAGGRRYPEPLTVAHALLHDLGAYLPS